MIYLTKGQALFNNQGMVVCDPSGYYEDGVSVTCAMFFAPDEPVCRYEAKFVAYGDQVYNISDEDALIEAITKIDPETLFGKTKEEVSIDKLIQEIKTVENPTPELTQDVVDENNANVDNLNTTTEDTSSDTTNDNTDTTTDITTDGATTTETTTETTSDGVTTTTVETTTTDNTIDSTIPDTTTTPDIINTPTETTTGQPVSMLSGKRKKKLI